MKKLLPLVFICLLGFYACKKDADTKSDADSSKIIGKWTHVRKVILNYDSTTLIEDNVPSNDILRSFLTSA